MSVSRTTAAAAIWSVPPKVPDLKQRLSSHWGGLHADAATMIGSHNSLSKRTNEERIAVAALDILKDL
eukprot:1179046-Pleurochrysis_carterae.AAC.1